MCQGGLTPKQIPQEIKLFSEWQNTFTIVFIIYHYRIEMLLSPTRMDSRVAALTHVSQCFDAALYISLLS